MLHALLQPIGIPSRHGRCFVQHGTLMSFADHHYPFSAHAWKMMSTTDHDIAVAQAGWHSPAWASRLSHHGAVWR
jgi:hypothetical protein